MMKNLVENFPQQIEEALKIGGAAIVRPPANPVRLVYIAGMGGSGIGANFTALFAENECRVPVLSGKGYTVPKYVDGHTLAIASSYSGGTEETLAAMHQMLAQKAHVVCIASGGKMIETSKKEGLDYVQLPAGQPAPRACLGYSFVAQLCILQKAGLISDKVIRDVGNSVGFLEKEQPDIQEKAKHLAGYLEGKVPVIYTEDRLEAVAIRFRQQLNENAKVLAWHHVLPEMNHNELVGWRTEDPRLAVVFLRSKDELPRNAVRMDITRDIVGSFTSTVIEVQAKGENIVEQALYLVHLADWVSVYLGEIRGMDLMEIKVIDFLKGELAKISQA